MEKHEAISQIRANLKFETVEPKTPGGQTCGIPVYKQRMYSEDLGLTIETDYHKSSLKNRQLMLKIFDSIIDSYFD
jgi:hypothetical protein